MSPYIEFAKLVHMERIKKYECPDCGNQLEQAATPGKVKDDGPYTHRDFRCTDKNCDKIWRVPRAVYEAAFGFWPE
jgi:hypothetical protein